jgi:hypothetical protein
MKRTPQREAVDDLADVVSLLPLSLRVEARAHADADLSFTLPDGRRIDVQVKGLRSPAPPDVARLGHRDPGSTTLPVLVADRLVPRVRDELNALGWGWLDRRGHLHLVGDGLLVDTEVGPLVAAADRSRPTLSTDVGLDVATAVLAHPTERLSVRRLVAFTGRSLGAVHHALRGLTDDGLLGPDGRPLIPELFWEVSAQWRPRRTPLAAAPDVGDDRQARLLGLGEGAGDPEQALGWALCDTLAANAFGAPAVVRGDYPPDFYVPDERTVRLARQILGDPTTSIQRAASVAISPASWVGRHRVALGVATMRSEQPPWPAAHPVVVALDLSTDASRGREILADWQPPEPFTRVW